MLHSTAGSASITHTCAAEPACCARIASLAQQHSIGEGSRCQAHLAAQLGAFADTARVVAQQRAAVAGFLVHRRTRLDLRSARHHSMRRLTKLADWHCGHFTAPNDIITRRRYHHQASQFMLHAIKQGKLMEESGGRIKGSQCEHDAL